MFFLRFYFFFGLKSNEKTQNTQKYTNTKTAIKMEEDYLLMKKIENKFMRICNLDDIEKMEKFISQPDVVQHITKISLIFKPYIPNYMFSNISNRMYKWAITSNTILPRFLAWDPYCVYYIMYKTKKSFCWLTAVKDLVSLNQSLRINSLTIQLVHAHSMLYNTSDMCNRFNSYEFEDFYFSCPFRDMNIQVQTMIYHNKVSSAYIYFSYHGCNALLKYLTEHPGEIDLTVTHRGGLSMINCICAHGKDNSIRLLKFIELNCPGLISSLEF
jgi:hypothetical protein